MSKVVHEKLKIDLENDRLIMYGSSTESSGCVLRGVLTLKLNNSTSLKSLILRFWGTISVHWSQMLENGYERKLSDHQVLINHTWTFLPKKRDSHLLKAGYHSFEFELVLPGSLPESTHVDRYYLVQYQLKAIAERSNFLLPNYTSIKNIHLSRQKPSFTSDYFDPIIVANHWADKVDYELSIPTKIFSYGDTIPIQIQILPLAQNLKIKYISCIFKEYMTCKAINGWFNGKNKLHRRIIQYIHKDMIDTNDHIWSLMLHVKVPESMAEIQCDANNESVRVKHKLKFIMSIENEDGHISELRAVLPVMIAITNSIDGLPAYEEAWKTLPYDPALMMALISNSPSLPHSIYSIDSNRILPNYEDLL